MPVAELPAPFTTHTGTVANPAGTGEAVARWQAGPDGLVLDLYASADADLGWLAVGSPVTLALVGPGAPPRGPGEVVAEGEADLSWVGGQQAVRRVVTLDAPPAG